MSPEFLITTFIVVASPGTGVIYTLAAGLSRGARASILAAFACTLGIIPHMLAAITGLAAVLYASAVAFEAIKIAGVAYLLYLAWATLREQGALRIETEMSPKSARQVIVTGILINILNPKLSIFFFAFLPQFVDTGSAVGAPRDARPERGVHAHDVRGLRDVRRFRGRRPGAHRVAAAGPDVDAPDVRGRVRGSRSTARPHGARLMTVCVWSGAAISDWSTPSRGHRPGCQEARADRISPIARRSTRPLQRPHVDSPPMIPAAPRAETEGGRSMPILSRGSTPTPAELEAAAAQERLYSYIGLVLGGIIVLVGIYFIAAGIGGTSGTIKIPVPGGSTTVEIAAAPTGLVVALIGAAIVWITRPTVGD